MLFLVKSNPDKIYAKTYFERGETSDEALGKSKRKKATFATL